MTMDFSADMYIRMFVHNRELVAQAKISIFAYERATSDRMGRCKTEIDLLPWITTLCYLLKIFKMDDATNTRGPAEVSSISFVSSHLVRSCRE